MKEGDIGYAKVIVDMDSDDGWCFCSPPNHPDDIARGLVEGEWAENYQTFAHVELTLAELRLLSRAALYLPSEYEEDRKRHVALSEKLKRMADA
jgi:hypothetical protein